MKIGERICSLRKLKGITQEELANEIGVSRQCISLWETDQTSPTIENLFTISKIFKISIEELYNGILVKDNLNTNSDIQKENDDEKKPFFAHCVTILNEKVFGNCQFEIYGKRLILAYLIDTLMILFGILLICIKAETLIIVIVMMMVVIIFISILKISLLKKREMKLFLAGDNNRTQEYWFYFDHLEINSKTDNSFAKYDVFYNELTVRNSQNFIFIYFNSRISIVDKSTLDDNLQIIIAILKNCAKKYKSSFSNIENVNINTSQKKARQIKISSLVFFILSLLSIFIALILVAISNTFYPPKNPSEFTKAMWVFYPVALIPLTSLILGVFSLKYGLKGKGNIIVGIIFTILLVIYGSFYFL